MLYVFALILFLALHAIPMTPRWRNFFVMHWGEQRYRSIFRLLIIGCVVMIYMGWKDFPYIHLYEPPLILKQIHLFIMLPVVYLWVAAEVPNNLKRFFRHPMLTGMILWAIGHLLANGDLRSMLLFISLMVFSLMAILVANHRGDGFATEKQPIKYDVRVVMASVLLYALIVYFHENLFGMPVWPYFLSLWT